MKPDWLKDMPPSWSSVPFGSIFTQSKRKNLRLQRDFVLSVMKERGVIPYTEKGNIGNKVSDDLSGYKLVDKGDFVLNSMNLYMGSVGVSAYDGLTSTAYIVCKPGENVYAGYYNYLIQFKGFQEYVGLLGKGIMEIREAVHWTALKSVFVPLPDFDTQKAIAAFLDRETARIDRLIEKKERFRALINSKRKALVAGLVDGSLIHSDTAKAHSGWFSHLPTHWKVKRARFLFRERIDPSQDGSEELLTVSHISGVTSRAEKDVNMFLAETLEGYKLVQRNDLVVNTMWAWMGAIGVSPIDGCASPSYAVYRPKKSIFLSDYLDLVVRSSPFVAEVNRRSKGIWASRLRLYPDAFLDIPFPVPPIDEQADLVATLADRMEREETIAVKSEKTIALLKEKRAALITAAVTGQIDVREQPPAITAKPDRRLDAAQEVM